MEKHKSWTSRIWKCEVSKFKYWRTLESSGIFFLQTFIFFLFRFLENRINCQAFFESLNCFSINFMFLVIHKNLQNIPFWNIFNRLILILHQIKRKIGLVDLMNKIDPSSLYYLSILSMISTKFNNFLHFILFIIYFYSLASILQNY